uniref:Protection of telomeres protein 1 n=1 Tax=Nothobranchius furzeri TaxID=105023 RepID=A0A8C6NME3_NOTFU
MDPTCLLKTLYKTIASIYTCFPNRFCTRIKMIPGSCLPTDYCSSLKITDESNQKIVCTIFCREMDDHPKIFQNGDIIRLHSSKEENDMVGVSCLQGNNVGFSVVTFDGAVGGAVEPRSSRKFFSFDEHDRRRVEELRSWAVSQDVCSTVSAAVPLSGVQPKVYFDLTCQLLAKAPIDTTCMLLRVWDGTKCPYTQSDVTIDPDTIEGPASFSGTKKSFIANILVFDNHVVCIGAFLRIYNLRAVCESVKEPGLLRMDTDHLVFQLNGGTSFGKGIRVLPESSPDVQKLKRFGIRKPFSCPSLSAVLSWMSSKDTNV